MKKNGISGLPVDSLFTRFKSSNDTLWLIQGNKRVYRSKRRGLGEVINLLKTKKNLVGKTVFDKIVGRAAALLFVYSRVKNVYALTGSRQAEKILKKSKIMFHFEKTIPLVLNRKMSDYCPFEKLSANKKPGQFYKLVINNS